MRSILPRVTCPFCHRSVAINWLDDHNPEFVKGALFRSRRYRISGPALCGGSGRRLSDDGTMLR